MASADALRAPGVRGAPAVRQSGWPVLAAAGRVSANRCQTLRQAPVTPLQLSGAASWRSSRATGPVSTSVRGATGAGRRAAGVVCPRSRERSTSRSTVAAALPAAAVADPAATVFLGVCTMMVLAMNLPGLCLFYGGMLDSRNVVNTFATCMAVACALTLLWLGVGYSLVYGATGGAILGGLDKAFLAGLSPLAPMAVAGPGVPVPLHAVFQATYATITPCLIIGAYAGRMRFFPSVALCAGWMLAVYCPFARMVWGGGLLEQMGLIDFAGGIVIHITAGFAALITAINLKPRRSVPAAHGPPNLVSIMVGTGLIWATWLAFNAGSTPNMQGMHLSWVFATSMTAASTGGVTWLLADSCTGHRRPTALGLCLGIVAALVGITPAALFVSLPGAVAIGVITAMCCRAAMERMRATGIDDACEVFGLHGTGGIVGNALTALFASTQLGGTQVIPNLWAQFTLHMGAAAAACAWSGAVTWLLLAVMDACIPGGVRVTPAVEDAGLDAGIHGEAATQ